MRMQVSTRGSRQDFRPIRRSGSRQDFRPIRFNLKPQTLASFGHVRVAPQPACLAGSKVLLGERVAPLVSFSRPIAACGGDRAGMFWACETELIAKLIHRARRARWGLACKATMCECRVKQAGCW
jgi:hypothetical protein